VVKTCNGFSWIRLKYNGGLLWTGQTIQFHNKKFLNHMDNHQLSKGDLALTSFIQTVLSVAIYLLYPSLCKKWCSKKWRLSEISTSSKHKVKMPESIKENTSALPILSRCCLALAHVSLFSAVNTPMGYSAGGVVSSKMYFKQAKRSVGCRMLPGKIKTWH